MSVLISLIIFLLIAPGNFQLANLDLIVNLQKYFDSKLLLLVNEQGQSPNLLYKRLALKSFMVVLTPEKNSEIFFKSSEISFLKTLFLIFNTPNFWYELNWLQNSSSTLPPKTLSEKNGIYKNFRNKISLANYDILLVKQKSNKNAEIFKFYQTSVNLTHFSTFATWKNERLLVHNTTKSFSKTDLQGKNFNIAKSTFKGHEEEYQKLWVLFSEAMNFTITWVYAPAGGVFLANGTKTAVYEMLEKRHIDGTPSNFVVTNFRLNAYDYIWPAQITTTKIYVALHQELNWSSFIAPFNEKIWIILIIWIILCSLVNYLVNRSYSHENYPIFTSFQALCYQCGKVNGNSLSCYIAFLMPYLLAVIVIQHYSAALHSFLTVDKFELPFADLDGFIKNGKYKLAVQNKTYSWNYFNTDNGEQAEKIRNGLLVPPDELPENSSVGFRQICRHRWIFVTISEGITVREECPIEELKTSIFSTHNGILVWKGFPYVKEMSKLMKHLQFAGLVKWKYKNEIISNKDNNTFDPLTLTIIFPLFLFLLSSAVLSILILFCEFIY